MLLEQALQLPDRKVREIMIPRTDVSYLDITRPPEEILEMARREGYTRYPLCRDHLDDVIGIVHIRELFARGSSISNVEEIEKLAREPLYVPEGASAEGLLRQFQQRRLHMAIVVDEHGGTAGLATLEDVLEELTGEILDEFDVETPPIEDAGNGCVRVAGSLPVVDLARHFDVTLGSEESVTAGGLILEELGRVARVGDVVRVDRLGLRVLETRRRRVERVLAGPYEQVIAARPSRVPVRGGATT